MDDTPVALEAATTRGPTVLPRHDPPASDGVAAPSAATQTPLPGRPAAEVAPDTDTSELPKEILRPVLGFLANVTVVTALLVYFGWRRAETHAERLGIDESILGMSTREYLLRSVGPVLVLLVGIGVGGLVWLSIEPRLTAWLRSNSRGSSGPNRGRARRVHLTVLLLNTGWLLLPAVVVVLGYIWPTAAFVMFPVSIGVGLLLWAYARTRPRSPDDPGPLGHRDREPWTMAFVGVLVLVMLFWTASNYAEVLGGRLADDFASDISALPGVAVHSERRLHLEGPGVREVALPGAEEEVSYRYRGLRLLEHTGGKYFLVSDGWTTDQGVVFILRDDDPSLRFDFVR